MKKLTMMLLVGLFLCIGTTAFANSSFEPGRITIITLHDSNQYIVIYLDGGVITEEPCNSKQALYLDRNHPFFKEMYAALLSAFHAGTPVQGWVNGTGGWGGFPKLTRLDLIKG